MTDDQAVIAMVDSNLQRERIQPSEKAFAYKMKYDVLKRKSGRRKAGQVDHNSGKRDWRLSVRKLETVQSRCRDISRWLI